MRISLKDYTEKFTLVPESNTVVAEASDLEFPVGQWPGTLEIEAVNGVFFYQLISLTENVAHYYSKGQPKVKIFND